MARCKMMYRLQRICFVPDFCNFVVQLMIVRSTSSCKIKYYFVIHSICTHDNVKLKVNQTCQCSRNFTVSVSLTRKARVTQIKILTFHAAITMGSYRNFSFTAITSNCILVKTMTKCIDEQKEFLHKH